MSQGLQSMLLCRVAPHPLFSLGNAECPCKMSDNYHKSLNDPETLKTLKILFLLLDVILHVPSMLLNEAFIRTLTLYCSNVAAWAICCFCLVWKAGGQLLMCPSFLPPFISAHSFSTQWSKTTWLLNTPTHAYAWYSKTDSTDAH